MPNNLEKWILQKKREPTPDRGQSKILILLRNIDEKSLETEILIAICLPTGDKWQSKTAIYLRSSNVKSILDCPLSGVEPVKFETADLVSETGFLRLYWIKI